MINVFYCNGIIWLLILILYFLGWSDLCEKLDGGLLIFICIIIILSFIIGFIFRKKMKFIQLEENPHKTSKATIVLVILFLLDIIYARNIPIMNVLNGNQYNEIKFVGIPLVHNLISSIAIFYSIYLSYIYFCFKNKKTLIENIAIILFFIILMQRQNILICMIMFCNIWLSKFLNVRKEKSSKKLSIIVLTALGLLILYLFGVFGNIRYGDTWEWNDSSMICTLAKKNDKYPDFIPLEYFWGYTYMVTPLANLNYNITNYNSEEDFSKYIMEYVPDFISSRTSYELKTTAYLPVESLTVCTAYVKPYLTFGYFGMYIMLFIQISICAIIAYFTYKNNRNYFIVVCNALIYFLIFAFFDNTFTYSITALMLIYSIICSLGIRIKMSPNIQLYEGGNNKNIKN